MRRYQVFFVSLFCLFLIGCFAKPTNTKSFVDHLVVEVWSSSDCSKSGERIHLRATVSNDGDKTFVVDLPDRPVLDIWIGSAVSPLARWSDGKPLTRDLTRLELKPGDSKTIEMDWVITVSEPGFPVEARFIYSDKRLDDPLRPSVVVAVNFCAGPFGP